MTLLQRAKQIWPGLSEADLRLVLWTFTEYPAGKDEDTLRALSDAYRKSGGDLLLALVQADQSRSQMYISGQ